MAVSKSENRLFSVLFNNRAKSSSKSRKNTTQKDNSNTHKNGDLILTNLGINGIPIHLIMKLICLVTFRLEEPICQGGLGSNESDIQATHAACMAINKLQQEYKINGRIVKENPDVLSHQQACRYKSEKRP